MRCVYSPAHLDHVPELEVQHGEVLDVYEVPERIERIRAALSSEGSFSLVPPAEHGLEPVLAVHSEGLVRFVESAWARWDDERPGWAPLVDTVLHARLRDGMEEAREPAGMTGGLGFWCFDSSTPLSPGAYAAARASVDVALTATEIVLDGAPMSYGLCRPPGHHAAHSMFGGYCFFNNAAICAHRCAERTGGRIAVLDVDYHHGNGTQQILYRRPDVFYASLHGHPDRAYPYYTGFASETGAGPGEGTTLNLPLPAGCDGRSYMEVLEVAIAALRSFAPDLLIVSLGLDTYRGDPIADLALTTEDMRAMGQRIGAVGFPLVVLQEGGYAVDALGVNAVAWLAGAARAAGA